MPLFMGGLFNIDLFGFPLYFYMWGFLLAVAAIAYITLYYAWWVPMGPMQGLYPAARQGVNVSLVSNKYGAMNLVDEGEGKCILNVETDLEYLDKYKRLEEIEETKWEAIYRRLTGKNRSVQFAEKLECCPLERRANVMLQGLKCDIIQDSDDWSIPNSPQHKAIVDAIVQYNELHPDDVILTYAKFQKRLFEKKIPCPAEVNPIEYISWARVDAEFPTDLGEGTWSGKKMELVELIKDQAKLQTMQMAYLVLYLGIGLAALTLIVRLIIRLMG